MIPFVIACTLAFPTEDLSALKRAHAEALLGLADTGLEQDLFLDAERLLFEAEAWSDDFAERVRDGRDRLRARRVASVEKEVRPEFQAFFRSKAYTARRAELMDAKDEAVAETTEAALDRGKRALKAGDDAAAEAALMIALDLGVDEKALARAAGRKLAAALRERWDAARGVKQLELGERISGDPLEADQLDGKVVVWRSFSL